MSCWNNWASRFYTPWKQQKTKSFLVFSECIDNVLGMLARNGSSLFCIHGAAIPKHVSVNYLSLASKFRSSHLQTFFKIDVINISQYSQENLVFDCFLNKVEEASIQLLSYEYCEFFKESFFTEHLRWLLLKVLCPSAICPSLFSAQY